MHQAPNPERLPCFKNKSSLQVALHLCLYTAAPAWPDLKPAQNRSPRHQWEEVGIEVTPGVPTGLSGGLLTEHHPPASLHTLHTVSHACCLTCSSREKPRVFSSKDIIQISRVAWRREEETHVGGGRVGAPTSVKGPCCFFGKMAQKGEAGWEGPWSHLRILLGEEVDEAEASVRARPGHLLRQADSLQLPEGAGTKTCEFQNCLHWSWVGGRYEGGPGLIHTC